MSPSKKVLVIAGPSGVGKTTVMKEIIAKNGSFSLVRSATTRDKRNDGNNAEYIYTTRDEFMKLLSAGEILEFTEYVGNLYGTPYSEIRRILSEGKTPILILDVNGVRAMKKRVLDFEVCAVYLYAPLEVLSERLTARYLPLGEEGMEKYVDRMRSNVTDYKNMRLYADLFDTQVESLEIDKTVPDTLSAFFSGGESFDADMLANMACGFDFG